MKSFCLFYYPFWTQSLPDRKKWIWPTKNTDFSVWNRVRQIPWFVIILSTWRSTIFSDTPTFHPRKQEFHHETYDFIQESEDHNTHWNIGIVSQSTWMQHIPCLSLSFLLRPASANMLPHCAVGLRSFSNIFPLWARLLRRFTAGIAQRTACNKFTSVMRKRILPMCWTTRSWGRHSAATEVWVGKRFAMRRQVRSRWV